MIKVTFIVGAFTFLSTVSISYGQDFSNDSGSLLSRTWNVREVRCLLQGRSINLAPVHAHTLSIDAKSKKAIEAFKYNDGSSEVEVKSEFDLELSTIYRTSRLNDFSHTSKISFRWTGSNVSSQALRSNPLDLLGVSHFSFVQAYDAGQNDKLLIFKQERLANYISEPTNCPVGDVKVMILEDSGKK